MEVERDFIKVRRMKLRERAEPLPEFAEEPKEGKFVFR